MDTTGLDRFRKQLEELRSDLLHQLEELGVSPDGSSLASEGFDPGFADSAHSTAERGKVLALAERLREQLIEAERALTKITDGTYGICESCGDPIPTERLEALPYSTLCVTCKQRAG